MFLPQCAQTAGYKYHRINKFADHTSLWRGPCIDVDRHIDIRATIAESSGVQVEDHLTNGRMHSNDAAAHQTNTSYRILQSTG